MATKRSAAPPPPAAQAWRWVSVLHARLMNQLDQDAEAAGVVPFSWFEILSALEAAPGNRVRLKDLVDAVLLTRAGVSRLLDRIEPAGLLKREPCDGDRRGADAVLTPEGLAALSRAQPVYEKTIDDRFGRHLTASHIEAVITTSREILAANDWLPDVRPVPLTIGRQRFAE